MIRHPRTKRTPLSSDRVQPGKAQMEKLLNKSGIRLSAVQLEQLWRYHNLLRKRNQDRDLTRITGFEAMVMKHYVDCMIVAKFVKLPSPLLDIGTGAGFPGIPLKIRFPHLQFCLAEHRPRRVAFLNETIQSLQLKQISVFDHKVVSQSFQTPVRGVITRALETMDKTMLRTSACLEKGGHLIFLKGPNVEPEIREVEKRLPGMYRLLQDEHYQLPNTPHHRRLLVFEKLMEREI